MESDGLTYFTENGNYSFIASEIYLHGLHTQTHNIAHYNPIMLRYITASHKTKWHGTVSQLFPNRLGIILKMHIPSEYCFLLYFIYVETRSQQLKIHPHTY